MTRMWRRALGLLVVAILVLVPAACGGDDDAGQEPAATTAGETTPAGTETDATADAPTIVMGTKNFTEQYVLGELYRQALEAKGFDVELKSDIGSTEIIDAALTSGEIDFYPEYTGTMLTVVFGRETTPDSPEQAYEEAKALQENRGFTLLAMTPFSDSDAIAVTKEYAEEHSLETVGDLAELGSSLRIGGQPEFRTRAQGLVGLRENYAITEARFVPFAGISPYEALDQGTVDAAAIFSTDPPLASGKYVVLEDTQGQFGYQNVAPVVKRQLVEEAGPLFVETVDEVSALLSEEAIIAMNSAVAIDQRPAAEVAEEFLRANGLL